MKTTTKNEQDLENDDDLKRKYYLNTFLMTSQLDSHTTTDIKPDMEFHMMNIIYAALSISAQAKKMTFSCKDDCTLTKHTRPWTYSALRYFCYV